MCSEDTNCNDGFCDDLEIWGSPQRFLKVGDVWETGQHREEIKGMTHLSLHLVHRGPHCQVHHQRQEHEFDLQMNYSLGLPGTQNPPRRWVGGNIHMIQDQLSEWQTTSTLSVFKNNNNHLFNSQWWFFWSGHPSLSLMDLPVMFSQLEGQLVTWWSRMTPFTCTAFDRLAI